MDAEQPASPARAAPHGPAPRVALVHEWLVTLGGSDRVLLALHRLYPDAPIYVSLYAPHRLPPAYRGLPVVTSWLQRLPGSSGYHRNLVPLMPAAFRRFRLQGHDVVISSSHSCAKGVQVPQGIPHVCYCHTPMRYAWDLEGEYVGGFPMLLRPAVRLMLARLRRWDTETAQRVDHFIANSHFVADRIRRHYNRRATVIYPPVDTEYFTPGTTPGDYFLVASRLVPYKRTELAVQACTILGMPLVVAGAGPETFRLRSMAGPTVRFVGEVDDAQLRDYYRGCAALIFPGVEDFGLVPVEAQACGRPVVAFAGGGALESIVPGVSGVLFREHTVDGLVEALRGFDRDAFQTEVIRRQAERFSIQRFQEEISRYVRRAVSSQPSIGR